MSDDPDIERIAAKVRRLNAKYDQAMAKRRLQAARHPAWFPPAEFIGMAVMVIAIILVLTLLNRMDSPRCSAPSQLPKTNENTQGSSR